MSDIPDRHAVTPPPAELLGGAMPPPAAIPVLAEIRSDASLPLEDDLPLPFLAPSGRPIVYLVTWRFELSWADAQWIQQWLAGPANDGSGRSAEEALKNFIDTQLLEGEPPTPFLEYLGTFISTESSHASYTIPLAASRAFKWEDYQRAWPAGLDRVGPPGHPLRDQLVAFLKHSAGLATTSVEVLRLAGAVGDLARLDAFGNPVHPVIRILVT